MPTLRNCNTGKTIEVTPQEASELVGRRWVLVDGVLPDRKPAKSKAKPKTVQFSGEPVTFADEVAVLSDPRPEPAADNEIEREPVDDEDQT